MPMQEMLAWLLLGAVLWYLYDGVVTRERALTLARELCQRHDVQLLDESVAQVRLRPQRDANGRLRWRREYRFEVSLSGDERRAGRLVLLGRRLLAAELELEGGVLHEDPSGR